jgi:acyl-CoA synthetase (NDP forming)
MKSKLLIEKSLKSSNHTLCEDEAKQILKEFKIPVIGETRVSNYEDAIKAALQYGFPVVIKGLGEKLAHKTEMGLVKVGVNSEEMVKQTILSFKEKAKDNLEAILVQPMLQGKRELVAGMFQDPQFGPVIMFGLGGIFTEALNDVVFKLAPLSDFDIDQMLKEPKSKIILDNFRGEKKVNIEQLKAVLKGLSNIATTYSDIKEIDINPLIVQQNGNILAVDALIVTGKRKSIENTRPNVDKVQLNNAFYPKSIVFIGASNTIGKWGHMLLTNALSGKYDGNVYLVNPKADKILGKDVYKSVSDIKEDIDLAVITIPSDKVMPLIDQLKSKNTKAMLLITSGFSEVGKKGAELEKELVKKASEAGIIILGPNTMGICNPHIDFACSGANVHPLAGSTALVCQSGNMGTQLLAFAEQQDIGIRAFAGSGNEAMVTIEDYIEAFEVDEKTKSVVLYIESVKDGRRFFESAKRLSKKKPVIVLKGGRTKAGGKAAASHTGALASDSRVLNSAFKQAGIIQVAHPMDLLDLSALFSSIPLPKGNKVAIMTLGGGWGVVTADLCAENGLKVPELSSQIISTLNEMLPSYWSHGNPVDIVGENDFNIPMVAVEELLKWDGCDAVIHLGIHGKRLFVDKMADSISKVDPDYPEENINFVKNTLIDYEEKYVDHIIKITEKYEKPVLGVSLLTDETTRTLYRSKECKYNGVFFPSPERAVKALAGMCQYSSWVNSKG